MTEPKQFPQEYLNTALDYIQAEALRSSAIADWDALRLEAQAKIAGAQTTVDTYPVIEDVLRRLEDGHSMFFSPERVHHIVQPEKPLNDLPTGRRLSAEIAYIELTPVITPSIFDSYTAAARQVVRANSSPPVRGWIVDLRRNNGGNMYPMLAAAGDILGEGAAGTFVSAQNQSVAWKYRFGGAYYGDELVYGTQIPDLGVDHSQLPVAVLISARTMSSGEILAISFVGREKVRLLGEPTRGLTTANKVIPLSDGAELVLTTDAVADRLGKIYESAVIPDEIVATDWERFGTVDDPVIITAMRWLATVTT